MRVLAGVQTILTAFCGLSLAAAMLSRSPWLAYASVVFGSYFALGAAWRSLRRRSVDVNFLMVFAAAGSVALGHPLEAAVLLFLFSLSSTLESYAMARTRNAIEGLIRLRPDQAIRIGGEGDETVPVSDLVVGDRIRVLPYEHVPADARILSGSSSVDQRAMTGESMPVPCGPGDLILAGTQNLDGMVVAQVAAATGDNTLEKIVELVRDAQENKASGERISHWFGQTYTFAVIAAFGVALGIRLAMGQPAPAALYGALTLLVALSPCAVVISTPASTLSALAYAARRGMLVRGGEFIELAGRVDALAVDKTGTLTRGVPELAEICVCTGVPEAVGARERLCVEQEACWEGGRELSEPAREVLRLAAAAEQYSTHPIAEAIVRKAREFDLDVPEARETRSHSGLGVSTVVDGSPVRIGQRRFFESDGPLDPAFAVHVEELQRKGMTVAILEAGNRKAALGLQDEVRPEAREFLLEARSLGIRSITVLTGDTPETAAAVAGRLGIEDVRAGLLPDQKTAVVKELALRNRAVMMVGDGVNDAPSLARATIGVAMGGLGSDIALNAADVVLIQDRLSRVPELIRLGRMANSIIRTNLMFATAVIVVLTVGSMLFDQWLPQYRNLLLPFAVVGHEGSTVLVILNGLRLLRGP